MFCFKLWSNFGVFRDPLTITQNLTFPIPPKTTIGGMMAAILGIDYNTYFNDPEYFDFKYSLVLEKPIRKKSFAQNYVADYTKVSETKISTMEKYFNARKKYNELVQEKKRLDDCSELSKKEEKFLMTADKKIEAEFKKLKNGSDNCSKVFNSSFRSPKPIFRELLIDPEYLIFVKDFKHEEQIIPLLQTHFSAFYFYMGNSEFPANYRLLDCEWGLEGSNILNSFTANPSKIVFEEDKKYTNVYMATKTIGAREYREYKNFILCDKSILLKDEKQTFAVKTNTGKYYCEFV
ncbi:CRISPR-associated protein Cas5 [Desulfobacula sp.]|uniref:CRISPR-associated protein Cas5 n=1 Tax=Desulfobacula sp. TaxID=2593537 RepID=UPI0027153D62|nr:CRISPR-associated protein Cas5 [Desulfobacula sp.]